MTNNSSPQILMNYVTNYLQRKDFSGEKLPPTLDALLIHLRRAAYQCFIWKSASDLILSLPQPVGNGWIESDGLLSPEYMVLNSFPEGVLELVQCKCGKGCKTNSCLHWKSKLVHVASKSAVKIQTCTI